MKCSNKGFTSIELLFVIIIVSIIGIVTINFEAKNFEVISETLSCNKQKTSVAKPVTDTKTNEWR